MDLLPPNPLGMGGTSGRSLLCETECARDRLTDAPSPPFEFDRGVAIVGREGVDPPIDFRGVRDGGGRNAPPRDARDRIGARGVETPFVEAANPSFSGEFGRDFGLAACVGVPIVECERFAAATRFAASSCGVSPSVLPAREVRRMLDAARDEERETERARREGDAFLARSLASGTKRPESGGQAKY